MYCITEPRRAFKCFYDRPRGQLQRASINFLHRRSKLSFVISISFSIVIDFYESGQTFGKPRNRLKLSSKKVSASKFLFRDFSVRDKIFAANSLPPGFIAPPPFSVPAKLLHAPFRGPWPSPPRRPITVGEDLKSWQSDAKNLRLQWTSKIKYFFRVKKTQRAVLNYWTLSSHFCTPWIRNCGVIQLVLDTYCWKYPTSNLTSMYVLTAYSS